MKRLLIVGFVVSSMIMGGATVVNAQMVKIEKKEPSSSKKGWLGVRIQDITSELKKSMDLQSREGALVSEVTDNSPADSAGIKEKDVIVRFGSESISDASDLQTAVAETKPGTKVSVVVLRKGEKKTLDVVVGKQKTGRAFVFSSPRGFNGFEMFNGGSNEQGMALRQMNNQLAKYFDVPEGMGVLVWEVRKGSAAEKAGINAGDVITVIGEKKIKMLRDVSRALGIFDEGEKAEIQLMRKGVRKTVTLEIAEGNDGEGYQFRFRGRSFNDRDESMLFDVPNVPQIDVRIPDIEFEASPQDFDHIRIEMNNLRERLKDKSLYLRENGEHLKEQARALREKIQSEVLPRVAAHLSRSI